MFVSIHNLSDNKKKRTFFFSKTLLKRRDYHLPEAATMMMIIAPTWWQRPIDMSRIKINNNHMQHDCSYSSSAQTTVEGYNTQLVVCMKITLHNN